MSAGMSNDVMVMMVMVGNDVSLVGTDVSSADSSMYLQASNGGHTSDYSSSLPSSPNVGHRELRAEAAAVAGLSTPGSLHRAAKRRTSLFAVLTMPPPFLLSCCRPPFLLSHCLPVILSVQTSLLGSSSSLSCHLISSPSSG